VVSALADCRGRVGYRCTDDRCGRTRRRRHQPDRHVRHRHAAASIADDEPTYATFEGEPLRLSIYRPSGSGSRAPVLVYIHGGGWVAGDRNALSTDMRWFAEQGWLVISVDYALSGASAGGNLAINTAYLSAAGGLRSSCGGTMPKVGAVAAMYPAVDPAGFYANRDPVVGGASRGMASAYTGGSPQDFPDRYARISSDTHINAAAPPTLIVVGEADHLVPVDGTYRFTEQARAVGVDVKLVAVPYADHVFDGRRGSIGQQAYRQLTARWLRDHDQSP
jgi:acetyl esterase/lipase